MLHFRFLVRMGASASLSAASVGDVASRVSELYPKQAEKYATVVKENLIDGTFIKDLKESKELRNELFDQMGCTKLHQHRLEREIESFDEGGQCGDESVPPSRSVVGTTVIENEDKSWDPSQVSFLEDPVPADASSVVKQMNALVKELSAVGWAPERSHHVPRAGRAHGTN